MKGFPQVVRPTFGNLLYFEQLLSFPATFCAMSNFKFSSSSEILLVLKFGSIPILHNVSVQNL